MPISPAAVDRSAIVDTPAAAAPGCAACPHAQADHDAVSQRYCQATVTSALTRGCVCRVG